MTAMKRDQPSVKGQIQTHAVRQMALSLDHLVGDGEQIRWDHQIESFCGLDVDLENEFGRLLNGLFGRTRSSQDAINVAAGLPPPIESIEYDIRPSWCAAPLYP